MDVLLKATKVEGVYERDPISDPSAKMYSTLDYNWHALNLEEQVMDATAISSSRRTIFRSWSSILAPGNVMRVVRGTKIGTLIAPRVGAVLATVE